MNTTTEEKINEAIKHLNDAYLSILTALEYELVNSDLTESYIDKLHEVSAEILVPKRKL